MLGMKGREEKRLLLREREGKGRGERRWSLRQRLFLRRARGYAERMREADQRSRGTRRFGEQRGWSFPRSGRRRNRLEARNNKQICLRRVQVAKEVYGGGGGEGKVQT
jgi:hypothetical protein